ncbi:MAG: electron transfer flavoprotein subunit beta/FixA family protein [Anaerolineae bacterium]|nr:electron transfer flavoprotein subunit beta/FixA family protein [Anaerolineae bacterium]MBT7190646.1 electron transfer flavoprotein subunit beta/FixA family protein [Anaerolineae bacterium]MBT7990548.1 electron transfer flavoprotein subunit beta/FixA family protein [Anaerolineae bacterium]
MKIVVCVKVVPDSAATLVAENGQPSWGDAPLVINPWDEYAVEAALNMGGDVTVISMGDESAKEATKHALAMGCNEAILISDPALSTIDTQGTAKVLAAAIQKIGDVDMVFFGKQAIDGDSGITPAQTARVLGYPALTLASSIEVDGSNVKVERSIEEGSQTVSAALPAVFSLVKEYGEPRYPSFMGIRKASRAQVPVWDLAELGIEAPTPAVTIEGIENPPARDVSIEMIEGGSPTEIAEKLADKIMAEKIL